MWVYALDDSEYDIDSACVLTEVVKRDDIKIALDCEHKILTEYENRLKSVRRHYQAYYKRFQTNNKFVYYSSKLAQKHLGELEKRGFHEKEDQVFVGVAMNADKIIVSNDGDYGIEIDENKKDALQKQKVYEYMTQEMGLKLSEVPFQLM